jgi:hypothetical protein
MTDLERCLERNQWLELSDIKYLQQFFWSKACNSPDRPRTEIYKKLYNDFVELEKVTYPNGKC